MRKTVSATVHQSGGSLLNERMHGVDDCGSLEIPTTTNARTKYSCFGRSVPAFDDYQWVVDQVLKTYRI